MKRELRDVLRQLEDLERALRDEEMRVSRWAGIKEFSSLLERLEGEKREAEHQSMTSGPHAAAARFGDGAGHRTACEFHRRDATAGGGARQQESIHRDRQSELPLEQARIQPSSRLRQLRNLSRCCAQRREDASRPVRSAWSGCGSEERHRSATRTRASTLFVEMNQRVHT